MHRAKHLSRLLLAVALGAGLLALQGCASTQIEPYLGSEPKSATIYVIAAAWHTEIGLPTDEITGQLGSLVTAYPSARYLVFGWGARDFYMAPHPGLGDLLAALTPGPAVMLVIPVATSLSETFGQGTEIFPIAAAPGGVARLSSYLWDTFAKDRDGALRPIEAGPYPGSSFYAASGTYDLSHTCNTFTAEALRVAGVAVDPSGVVTAGDLKDQLTRNIASCVRSGCADSPRTQ